MELNSAFFTASVPFERKLTLTLDSGEVVEQTIHIKEVSALEMRKQVLAETSGDEDRVGKAQAALIAMAVCDADGGQVMTVDQACRLKPGVAADLRDLILEVNGLGKKR